MGNDYSRVRETVGCFEDSSTCTLSISGDGAEDWLNSLFTKDIESLPPLKGSIGLFLDEAGDVIAIVNIFRDEDNNFFVFGKSGALKTLLTSKAPEGVTVHNLEQSHRTLVVVGPLAQDLMTEVASEDILAIPYMGFEESVDHGYQIFRQGFGGEFEYHLLIDEAKFSPVQTQVESAAQEFGGGTIDPQIMDLICFEMRSISDDDVVGKATPLEAGLHWMIDFQKENYVGRAAVVEQKTSLKRKSLIVRLADAGATLAGANLTIEHQVVGQIVRVEHSPRLGYDIGFAYLDRDTGWVGVNYAVQTKDGQTLASAVSSPQFVARSVLSD